MQYPLILRTNGRCLDVITNSKARMSIYLDTSTKAQMAQIMVQYGRPSRSSRKKSVRSSSGRTMKGKAIREKLFWNTVGKSLELGMFICVKQEDFFYQCTSTISNWYRQDRKHGTDLENFHERRWSGRTNIIPWPCLFWVVLFENVK